jgi:dimethylamine/trimethylamine dehydrogenase
MSNYNNKIDNQYGLLFTPLQVGPKLMRNRFYKVPHCTGFGAERPGAQAGIRGVAAEGGWAVVNTESCSIHPSTDEFPLNSARIWDDDDASNLALMVRTAQAHGTLVGVELDHGGAHMTNYESRHRTAGVSQIQSDLVYFQNCYTLDRAGIIEIQQFYVQAAIRAMNAGFDLINVYGGHGHSLPHQFLDPWYNKRTDEYGGSLENRARFWLETIQKVRAAVGDRCAVVARIGLDNLREGGLGIDDTLQFIRWADDMIDLWDVQIGMSHDDVLASRVGPTNARIKWLERVRECTDKPVVGVGRFTDPDLMVRLVKSGVIDCVGSARSSIADPFIPDKIRRGRAEDIRECIGCNICISRFEQNGLIICSQNPTAGEEFRRGWHPEHIPPATNSDDDVLIVGAGPAGLECAHILGKRGFGMVHLVDAAEAPGGSLRHISALPGQAEWRRVIAYREGQIAQLESVEVIPETRLSADDIMDYGAGIVVIATGSTWATDGLNGVTHAVIPGADAKVQPHVLTPDQVFAGKPVPEGPVVIYDTDGYFMAGSLAEKLVSDGHEVTIVTPFKELSPYTNYTAEHVHLNRGLRRKGVRIVTDRIATAVQEDGLTSVSRWLHEEDTTSHQAASIMLVTQRNSDDAVYADLMARRDEWGDAEISAVYRIGDCIAPGLIADAVFDGHRLAREIDSEDPATHKPFIRERQLANHLDNREPTA